MLAAEKGNVIHNIVIFARAIVFRQILIAAQLRESIDGNRREAAEDRIRHARVDPITAQRCCDVVYVIEAMMEIPAEPQIVHPSGIRGPGPARCDKLGPESRVVPKRGLRDSRVGLTLGERLAVAEEVRPRQRMMIARMGINLTKDVVNTDNIRETVGLAAGGGPGGCVCPK